MQDNKDLRPSLLTLLFSLLFLGLAAAGCDEDDGDKKSEEQPPKLCTSDSQCQPTEYCMVATGLCLTGCRLAPADSCAAGFFCDEATHTCVANPCTGDADCAADHWCRIPEGETGGACVAGCRLEPDSCPEGKHCEAGAQDHACVDDVPITCATAGCPDGQHCHPGLLVCVQCLERAHCAEDELCVSNACEQACPDGCPEGEVCNLATRQCDPIDCVEAGVCPGGQICCPGTRRCTPGECRSATCCRGDLDCIEEGNRWCRDAHAANYYCGEDNSCGVETCRDDGSCPEDSWCDMATDPPACRRGCRMDGCDLPGQVCDPETRSCAYSRCPNGQQDCTCTPDEQFYCSPRTGRCEPGCCGDEVCDQVIGEHCDEESRVCTPLICARGNVDCRRAPWPDGTFCDGRLDPPRCMPGCQLDDDCPDGKPCTAGHVCGCQRDEDCAAGLKCRAELCVAECASHADCPDGYCGEDDRCQEGCLADAFEENDDRQHAALLPTADGQHQWLSICRGEEDWYAVHLRPGDSLAFQLSFDHEQMMVVAQIYHPDPELGALVTSTNGPLDDSAVVELDGARVVSEGDYLIRVMAVQPLLASGFYDMEVLFEAGHHCRGDALEGELGNDTQGQAATIEAQTYSELTLCPRDADWFRIALAAGDTITARATCDGQHRMKLALYDVQGAQLTFAESWCWNQVRRQVANAGTYFLEVSHSANAEREEIDPYELGVFVVHGGGPCPPDRYEPNDTKAVAFRLADLVEGAEGNVIRDGRICSREQDWFVIPTICPMDRLTVRLEFSNAQGDLDLELHDAGQRIAISNAVDRDFEEVTVNDRLSAPHFVKVVPAGMTNVDYTLRVSFECPDCDDDLYDAAPGNDTIEQAAPLLLGRHEQALRLCPREQDWYVVDLDDPANLKAQICFHHIDCDLELAIYDEAKALLNPWCINACPGYTSTDNECVLRPQAAGGRYYLNVYGSDASMSCSYGLKVERVADGVQCPGPADRSCP